MEGINLIFWIMLGVTLGFSLALLFASRKVNTKIPNITMMIATKKIVELDEDGVGVVSLTNLSDRTVLKPAIILTSQSEWHGECPDHLEPKSITSFRIRSDGQPRLVGYLTDDEKGTQIYGYDGEKLPFSLPNIPDDYCILWNIPFLDLGNVI